MIEPGRIHTLVIDRLDDSGAWLKGGDVSVLLPRREVPAEARPGGSLTVFVVLDGSGRPVATVRRPLAQVGEFALLRVSQVTRHGAFLDWGLEKELLVPFAEQPERMQQGRRYLVRVGLDDRGRAVGTARLDRCLENYADGLAEGEGVDLIVWEFTDLGAKVIIDDRWSGLLYKDEIRGGLKRGERLRGYVRRLREDGKIDVTLREPGAAGVESAKATLLAALAEKGFLPLHDQSPPWAIQEALGMSKKTFKKAVGGLYKEQRIELVEGGIRLKPGG